MAPLQEEGRGVAQWVGAAMLGPSRTGLALVLGSAVLVGRATRWIGNRAIDEGERQLTRLNGSLERAGAGVWSWSSSEPESESETKPATMTPATDQARHELALEQESGQCGDQPRGATADQIQAQGDADG